MADIGLGTRAQTTLTNGSAASTSSESDKENMPSTMSCDFDTLYQTFLENVAPPPGQMKSRDSSSSSSSRLDPLTENTPVRFTSSNSNPHATSAEDGKGMQQLSRLVKMMEQMCVLTEQNTKLREQANYLSAMKDLEKLRSENLNKKYDAYGNFTCNEDYYRSPHHVEEVVSEPESIAGEDINAARERSKTKRKGRSTSRNGVSVNMKTPRSQSHGRVADDDSDHAKKGIFNFVHKITSKTKKQGSKMEDSKISKTKYPKGKDHLVEISEPSVYFKTNENSDIEEVFDKSQSYSDGYFHTKESDLSTSSNDELVDSPGKPTLQRSNHVLRGKRVNLARQTCVTHDYTESGSDYHSGHRRALSFDAIERNDREPDTHMRKSDTQPDIQVGSAQLEQTNKDKGRRLEGRSASSDMLVSSKPTSNEKRGKVTSGWDHIKDFIRNKPPGQCDVQLDSREGPIEKRATLATGTDLSKDKAELLANNSDPIQSLQISLPGDFSKLMEEWDRKRLSGTGNSNYTAAEKPSTKKRKTGKPRKDNKSNRSKNGKKDKTEVQATSSEPGYGKSLERDGQLDVGQEVDMSKLTPDFKLKLKEWEEKQKKKQLVRVKSDSQADQQTKMRSYPQRSISTDLELETEHHTSMRPYPQRSASTDLELESDQQTKMRSYPQHSISTDLELETEHHTSMRPYSQCSISTDLELESDQQTKMRSYPQRSASTDLELVSQFDTVHATPAVVQSNEGQDIVPSDPPSVIQPSPDIISIGRSSQDDLDHTADSESQNSVPSMNIASDSTSVSELKSEENFEDGILPDLVDTAESHIIKLEEMNLLLADELHYKTANLQQITEEIQKMQEEIAQLGTDISVSNQMSDASMGVTLEKELCNIKSEVTQLEERFKPVDAQQPTVNKSSQDVSKETQTKAKKADDEKSLEESLRERETLVKLLQSEISRQANEINYLRSRHQGSRRGKSFCSSDRPGAKINKKRSNSDRIRRTSDEDKLMMKFSGATLKEEVTSVKVPVSKKVTASATQIGNKTITTSDRPLSCVSTGAEHDGAISLTASGSSKYERPLSMISGCTVISERDRPVSIASSLASSGSTRLEVTSDSTPSLETLHISAEDIRLSEILSESEENVGSNSETLEKQDGAIPIPKPHQVASRNACNSHGIKSSTKYQNTEVGKPSKEIQPQKPLIKRHQSLINDREQELIGKIKETLKESEGKTEAPPLSPSKLTKIEPQIELVKLAKSPQSQRVDIGQKVTAQTDTVRQKPEIPEKKWSLEKRESIKRIIENEALSNAKKHGVDRFSKATGKVVTRRATSDDIRSSPAVWKDPMFSKRRDSFESLAKLSNDNTQSKQLSDNLTNQDENQVQNLKKKFMQHRVGKNIETLPSVNVLKPRSYRTARELPKEGCVKQLSQAFSLGNLDETKTLTGSTPQSLSPASSCSSIPVIAYSSTVATHIRRLKNRTTDSSFEEGYSERPKSDPKSNLNNQLTQVTDSAHTKSSPDLAIKNEDKKPDEEKSKSSPKKEKPSVPRKKPQSSKSVDNNAEDRRARRNGAVFTYTVSVDGSDVKSSKDQTKMKELVNTDQRPYSRHASNKLDTQTEDSVTFTVNKRTGFGRKNNTTENQNNNNTSYDHLSRGQRSSISDRKQLFEKFESTVNKPSTPRKIAVEIKVLNNLALVGGKEDEDTSTNSLKISSCPQASTEKIASSGSSTEKIASSGSEKSLVLTENIPSSPKKNATKESELASSEERNNEKVVRRQRKFSSRESNNNQLDSNINNNNNNNNENSIQPAIEQKRRKKNSKVERRPSKKNHDIQKSGKEIKAEKQVRERKSSTSKVEPRDIKSPNISQTKKKKDSSEGVTNNRWSFTGKHKEDAKVDSKQTQNTDKGKGKKRSSSKQRSNGSTDSLFSKSRDSKERSSSSSCAAEGQAASQQHRKGSTESKDGTSETSEPRERRSRIDKQSRRSRSRNKPDRVNFFELIKRSPSVDGSKIPQEQSMKPGRPVRAQSVDRTSRSSWFSKKTDSITNFLRMSNVDDCIEIDDWSEYLDFCQDTLDYLHEDYTRCCHNEDVWQLHDELHNIRETSILT
ncbi:putative leucine-rich repeat-containing protein DDB_G0290503 isoform X2 [Anneissia japonica]|uniref:putative leucine-rich repeat-containing protein DDB_G0290503 isoform X2 n=1 Tax=Anneissia japonica TaxID=1529436 RepID=UPI0014255A0D|nr:putative leucine-rich repeat-containing protein DDB_G0290503 isoform X2 [Anneissia japonica]